jgi:hypothetical protein
MAVYGPVKYNITKCLIVLGIRVLFLTKKKATKFT